MTSVKQRIKSFVLSRAPAGLLQRLKKRHYLRELRVFSEPDVDVVKALVRPGDRVVDVGANTGWYTRVLSECVGPEGHVTSIEPIPPTFEILDYCVRSLGLRNVEVHHCAVSREEGEAWMEVPPYEEGGENFYQAHVVGQPTAGGDEHRFRVGMRTLDALLEAARGQVSFVKCDVEGHELAVLEGSARLLEIDRPAWLLEVSGDPDDADGEASRVFERLERDGYRAWWYDGSRLRPRRAGDVSVNYFFLTPAQSDDLQARGVAMDPAS